MEGELLKGMKYREDEQVYWIPVSYDVGFDPTESESKSEESRLASTLSPSMSLHRFRSVFLIQNPLPNTVAKDSVTMTQCGKLSFHIHFSRKVHIM